MTLFGFYDVTGCPGFGWERINFLSVRGMLIIPIVVRTQHNNVPGLFPASRRSIDRMIEWPMKYSIP